MNQGNKGFTLIELLVVIAIIGILSGIVLTSLNSARQKASDAAVQGDLVNAKAAAEIIYTDTSSYASICNTSGNVVAASTGVTPYFAKHTTNTCYSDTEHYAFSAPLVSDSTHSYCVDSVGGNGKNMKADSTFKCVAD